MMGCARALVGVCTLKVVEWWSYGGGMGRVRCASLPRLPLHNG